MLGSIQADERNKIVRESIQKPKLNLYPMKVVKLVAAKHKSKYKTNNTSVIIQNDQT